MQFTSIPSWFSIGQSAAESHIVWWTFACDLSQWFHGICTCFAIDCNNIIVNSISHAGNKPHGRCAEVDLRRRKATLQLSVFFQGDCAWVRTRQPEINVSKKGGLEESGWLQWLDQEPLCSTKWDLQTLQSTFPKDCQSARSKGRLGGKKAQIYRWEGFFFCCLPVKSTVTNYCRSISSWVWCGADRQRC